MKQRVALITLVQLAVSAGCLVAARASAVAVPRLALIALIVPLALACTAVGSLQMHIELRRHSCAVTFVEAVVVIGLIHLGVWPVVVAAALGELLTCLVARQPMLQLKFNVTAAAATTSVAGVVFTLLPHGTAGQPTTWLAGLAAAMSYGFASHVSTSAVLTVVDGRSFKEVLASAALPSAAATTVSGSLGVLGVVLLSISPWAVLLTAPLVLLMVLETRRLAAYRADHLRFERLYAASARSGGLTNLHDAMATLAEEARSLVTGAVALCCATDTNDQWCAVVVGDSGVRAATPQELAATLGLAHSQSHTEGGNAAELSVDDVPTALRHLSSPLESLVFASSDEDATHPVVIAVARHLPGDNAARTRADVLGAFIGHAALTVANARLYADVEVALARQVDLNRQKDDFVASVSHELRTPLTSMIGAMSTMRRLNDQLPVEKREGLVDIALRQGDRLRRLIEDLLLISKVEATSEEVGTDLPITRVPIDVAAMVTELADHFRGAASGAERVEISFESIDVTTVCSDEARVRQIVANLIENARKYAPASPIVVRASKREDDIAIEVIDHGPGIAVADHERVFERFVQLDQTSTRAQGGTGLGLYLCRTLARGLGGSLTLTDAPGGGCCFTLTLPSEVVELASLKPEPAASIPRNPLSSAGIARNPLRAGSLVSP